MITHPSRWDHARWPNFSPAEFICKGSGALRMDEGFMDALQALRTAYGKPITITSGYRSPEHNTLVSVTGRTGPHTTGKACDIAVARADAWALLRLICADGRFTGIGINQKGAGRFIHIDMLTAGPRPSLWSY